MGRKIREEGGRRELNLGRRKVVKSWEGRKGGREI